MTSLLGTYGPWKVPRVMRNMAAIQDRLLEPMSQVNLLAAWPATKVPVHQVFGADDLLVPQTMVNQVKTLVRPGDTVTTLDRAGHSVHFDRPQEVRNLILPPQSERSLHRT